MSDHILNLLIVERTKLDAAIQALQDGSALPEFDYDAPNVPDWVKPAPTKKRRGLSAEGRQRIIDATKARWAARRAAVAESVAPERKTSRVRIAETVAEDAEFKSKMSIAMAKSWKKRRKAGKKRNQTA
jgi:hypothetical protein